MHILKDHSNLCRNRNSKHGTHDHLLDNIFAKIYRLVLNFVACNYFLNNHDIIISSLTKECGNSSHNVAILVLSFPVIR